MLRLVKIKYLGRYEFLNFEILHKNFGGQHFEFRNSKFSCFIDIKPIFLKLWILVFDFNESSEGVLHGHCFLYRSSV
jgi:hypothetical protein